MSNEQQIRLNAVPISVWVTKEILLLGVLPGRFSAALYDASLKPVFGFLLKRGILLGPGFQKEGGQVIML